MELEAILTILLSWASYLSGYPLPDSAPAIEFEQHAFFVENVCGGKECNVVGWYDDAHVIYIDEKFIDIEGEFAPSLFVHEFTHYLQHQSGSFESLSCEDSVAREREAYDVQNRYLIEGLASINLIRPGPTMCNYGNAGTDADTD